MVETLKLKTSGVCEDDTFPPGKIIGHTWRKDYIKIVDGVLMQDFCSTKHKKGNP